MVFSMDDRVLIKMLRQEI